jgi:hypothetical protein
MRCSFRVPTPNLTSAWFYYYGTGSNNHHATFYARILRIGDSNYGGVVDTAVVRGESPGSDNEFRRMDCSAAFDDLNLVPGDFVFVQVEYKNSEEGMSGIVRFNNLVLQFD